MSHTEGTYTSNTQYGATDNQFATTYTPADQSQNQYTMPDYNPYTASYQQNIALQYNPYTAPYAPGNMYNTYGQPTSQSGGLHPEGGSYGQGPPSNTHEGQYSHVAPPYDSGGLAPGPKEPSYQAPPPSYNQAPSLSYHQAPPPSYNQAPPPSYNQALPPSYNHAPPPSYNQAPPPSYPEKSACPPESYQQGPTYSQSLDYPQEGVTYPQQSPNYPQYPPQPPNGANQCPQNTSSYQPAYDPKRPPKRPHMPPKLQTRFKQGRVVRKTAAKPPQVTTTMQPLQAGKSAVSSAHDLAHQNGYTINWYEESETGPAHAKVFSMRVTMGPYEVTGSGRSKKLAKQDAAQLLLTQVTGNTVADIIGLPGFTGNTSLTGNTSQSGSTTEEYGPQLPEAAKTSSVEASGGDNPISILTHTVRKHRLGEAQYITVGENGPLSLQRFEIKVQVNDMEASGLGRSKKVAKRNAAQAMLDQLSRNKTGIEPPKKRIMFVKASSETSTNDDQTST